jgi:hypothetical protein
VTHSQALLSRCALAAAASAGCIVLLSVKKLRELPRSNFNRIFRTAFVISRLGVFALVFLVLHIAPRGDLNIYGEEAAKVAQGQLPYRGVPSSYAPLHPYLDVVLLRLGHGPLGIILFAIVCECVLVFLWLPLGRSFLNEQKVRHAALLYLTSAVSLQFVTIDGQNNIIVALLVTLGIFAIQRSRPLFSGLAVGFSIALIKFLPLMYVPVFLAHSLRRWRWLAGFLLGCVPVYATCVLLHLPFLSAITREGSLRAASNLIFFLESALGIAIPSRLADGLVLLVLAVLLLVIVKAGRHASPAARVRVISFGSAALTLTLILLAKKSWPPYLMLMWFPVCLAIPLRRLAVLAFALFNIVAVAEPSVWAGLLAMATAEDLHRRLHDNPAAVLAFLFLEALLLIGYTWLLYLAIVSMKPVLREIDQAPLDAQPMAAR